MKRILMDGHSQQPVSAALRLREMLSNPSDVVVAPGVYDGISARLAMAQGFECLYMTGAGTSMSRLGMADLGLATFTDMYQNAAMIASISGTIPVIADADTVSTRAVVHAYLGQNTDYTLGSFEGYGGPINVAHTVRAYARAGIAALHIEDQVTEKRCGHLAGKLLVSRDVYYNRLRAACKARDESGTGIMIIARTDARAGKDPDGNSGFAEAMNRLTCAAEIGVDALFLEALQDEAECKDAVRCLPKMPLLLNMVPGGKTPIMKKEEAQKLGFRILIWPTIALEAVIPAIENAMKTLRKMGRAPADEGMGPTALFEVCGLRDLMKFDADVGGQAYSGR